MVSMMFCISGMLIPTPTAWTKRAASKTGKDGANQAITVPTSKITIAITKSPLVLKRLLRKAEMGINGLVIGLAPAIGPTLSGWVIDNFSWRWLFGMIVPIAGVVIVASFFLIKNVIPNNKPHLDWLSVILSTAGFGSMLYGFSSVGDKGWTDPVVLASIIIGAILVIFLVLRQNKRWIFRQKSA